MLYFATSGMRAPGLVVANTMTDRKILVEKFDGTYYKLWRMKIKDYLYVKDMYRPFGTKPKYMND